MPVLAKAALRNSNDSPNLIESRRRLQFAPVDSGVLTYAREEAVLPAYFPGNFATSNSTRVYTYATGQFPSTGVR